MFKPIWPSRVCFLVLTGWVAPRRQGNLWGPPLSSHTMTNVLFRLLSSCFAWFVWKIGCRWLGEIIYLLMPRDSALKESLISELCRVFQNVRRKVSWLALNGFLWLWTVSRFKACGSVYLRNLNLFLKNRLREVPTHMALIYSSVRISQAKMSSLNWSKLQVRVDLASVCRECESHVNSREITEKESGKGACRLILGKIGLTLGISAKVLSIAYLCDSWLSLSSLKGCFIARPNCSRCWI